VSDKRENDEQAQKARRLLRSRREQESDNKNVVTERSAKGDKDASETPSSPPSPQEMLPSCAQELLIREEWRVVAPVEHGLGWVM
jgi:hypothetical protein